MKDVAVGQRLLCVVALFVAGSFAQPAFAQGGAGVQPPAGTVAESRPQQGAHPSEQRLRRCGQDIVCIDSDIQIWFA